MAEFSRPDIPYPPEEVLPNGNRYSLISSEGDAPTADDFDGDFNYIIDSINDLQEEIDGVAVGILPGANNPANVNKVPITNGQNPPNITWSSVTASYIASNAVTTAKINNGAVTNTKIANAAVNADKILPGSIIQDLMAVDSVGTPQLQDESVTTDKIADGAVTENEISDGAVTTNKIADLAVTTDKIADGAVTLTELADESVTASKIVDNTITAQEIADNTITRQQLTVVIQMPIGFCGEFSGPGIVAPAGWLFCNGQAISRATYAALFAVIGTTYGVGDGATTFNLEDKRGRVAVGIDMSAAGTGAATNNRITTATASALTIGGNGGFEQVTLDVTQIPPHDHVIPLGSGLGGNLMALGTAGFYGNGSTNQTGGGLPHNNMSPFILKQFIIYAGV